MSWPTEIGSREDFLETKDFCFSSERLAELMQSCLAVGNPFSFQAKGFSMSPFIKEGDEVTVSPLPDTGVDFGQVAAFKPAGNNGLAIHRVIGTRNDGYLLKGDNLVDPDGFVPRENLLGVVTAIRRGGQRIFFGLGPERCAIAFFSRKKILPFIFGFWARLPFLLRALTKRILFAQPLWQS